MGLVSIAGVDQPALWEEVSEGTYELALLADIEGNGGRAEAVIADSGSFGVIVAGWVLDPAQLPLPCVWRRATPKGPFVRAILPNDALGGKATSISDLSGGGPTEIGVGGWAFDGIGVEQPTVWTGPPAGPWTATTLAGLEADRNANVNDISGSFGSDAFSVGFAEDLANVRQAVRWPYDGAWTGPFGFPAAGADGNVQANGFTLRSPLGDRAAACGSAETAGITASDLWLLGPGSTETVLPTLAGFTQSQGLDLTIWNGGGDVITVGRSFTAPGPLTGKAVLWQETGGDPPFPVFDLNDPSITINLPVGVTLRRANHIVDRTKPGSFGQGDFVIVGAQTGGARGTIPHAFVLTTVSCLVDDDCDDGQICNGTETCDIALGCQAGTPEAPGTPCGDASNTDCTNPDTCNGSGNCLPNHETNGAVCDDGLFCTGADDCQGGLCTGAGDPCGGQICDETNDICLDCVNHAQCDDANVCTADSCMAGVCQYAPAGEGNPCSDGDACTVSDICSAGQCAGVAVDCSASGDDCNTASCNPAGLEGNCDIVTPFADGTQCDDADLCTIGDICLAGACTGAPGGPDCTITAADEVCDGSSGNIASVPDAGPGASYVWILTGGVITSGQGTNSITYNGGQDPELTIDVTVTDADACINTCQHIVAVDPCGAVYAFGMVQTPLGQATLDATPPTLIIANIGGSGEDGVSVAVVEAEGWLGRWEDWDADHTAPDGANVTVELFGSIDAGPEQSLGTVTATAIAGTDVSVDFDFSPLCPLSSRSVAYLDGELVGIADDVDNCPLDAITATDTPGGVYFGNAVLSELNVFMGKPLPPGAYVVFDPPAEVTIETSPGVFETFTADAAGVQFETIFGIVMQSFRTEVTAADVPSITMTDEALGFFGHGHRASLFYTSPPRSW